MSISQHFCGKHPRGEDLYLFTLLNKKGTKVNITNFGAIITSFKIKMAEGTVNDIVLGFDNIEDYWSPVYLQNYPWLGCAVGRYCNRIKNGTFSIDGQQYEVTKNKGDDTLHGGAEGFDKKVWQVISMGEEPFPFLELQYISPDGEEGFPGNLKTSVRFVLNDDNELSYEFNANSDQPTVINMTHHDYFNLDTKKKTIHEHELKIYATHILEQDKNLVVTGNKEPVAGTAYDFTSFRKIGDGLKLIDEYDKSYVVDQKKDLLVAEAKSPQSGIHLQVFSTEPVVHFYTGKWIPSVKGKNGDQYHSFSGFCLETHTHPNAVNIPEFPNTILRPGENYYQKTIYKVIA